MDDRLSASVRREAGLWVVLVLAAATVGCGFLLNDDKTDDNKTDDIQPAASLSPPDRNALGKFYSQELDWGSCLKPESKQQLEEAEASGDTASIEGYEVIKAMRDLECTDVEVPLDYADPQGETIEIGLNRLPAVDQANRIGSLLTNPGGPGESGWMMVATGAKEQFTEALRSRYDLVGFDPRGIGRSAPLSCVSAKAIEELKSQASPPEGTDEREQARKERERIVEGCRRNAGDRLSHVGTENVARDMDVLRAVLGDDKLHYLGFSYGTVLGQVYAEQFPQTVGRMVLDSAADPKVWPNLDSQIEQFAAMERELDEFVAWCVASGDCPLGATAEDARRALRDLVSRLETEPLQVPDTPNTTITDSGVLGAQDEPVTDSAVRGAIQKALYSPQNWPGLQDLLRAALAGDGATVRQLLVQNEGGSDPETQLNSTVAFTAVTCLISDGSEMDQERAQAFRDRAAEVSPFFGAQASTGIDCAHWPAAPTVLNHAITAPGSPPILVVANTRDNATPIQWARSVARQLENATLVENDADGHIVYGKGPCVNAIVDAYLLDGTQPQPGTACADTGVPQHQPDPPSF